MPGKAMFVIRRAVKVIATIAAFLFVFSRPLSSNWGAAAFFISIPLLLVCLICWFLLDRMEGKGCWQR